MKTQSILGVLTAFSASLCCITPVLAITTGTSSLASAFHWTEPLRPYFVGASILILGFAWFGALKPQPKDECGCEPKKTFLHSKLFLSMVTVVSALLIAFPSYSEYLQNRPESIASADQQDNRTMIELPVKGMTCSSCEVHIESTLKKLPGVFTVRASYTDASAKIEFDPAKITRKQLVSAINETGYSVGSTATLMTHPETCTKETCEVPLSDLPKQKSKTLLTLNSIDQLRTAFNTESKSAKFVAILSSTCKWCIQGAESINQTVIRKMKDKNLSVIIVWTNMLKSDDQSAAQYAASLFDGKGVTQFFDRENKFGDLVGKTISANGEKAWDIYLFFEGDRKWDQKLPRPFEYAHQLGPSTEWIDPTKYYCGDKLTDRLNSITESL